MNIFICSKPFQIMVSLIISRDINHNSKTLFIIDDFVNSHEIADSTEIKKLFYSVLWFKTKRDAISAAIKYKPTSVFVDSDVGFLNFISLLKLKTLSFGVGINVYEEGLATYSKNLIPQLWKKVAFKFFGLGYTFGGCFLTKKIHVFSFYDYKLNNPKIAKKAVIIGVDFQKWVFDNQILLLDIFCPGITLKVFPNSSEAILYVSTWSFKDSSIRQNDNKLISELSRLNNVYVKPHPHIKDNNWMTKFDGESIELLPAILPAELAIVLLMKIYKTIKIYHHNSTCAHYMRNTSLVSFNMGNTDFCEIEFTEKAEIRFDVK